MCCFTKTVQLRFQNSENPAAKVKISQPTFDGRFKKRPFLGKNLACPRLACQAQGDGSSPAASQGRWQQVQGSENGSNRAWKCRFWRLEWSYFRSQLSASAFLKGSQVSQSASQPASKASKASQHQGKASQTPSQHQATKPDTKASQPVSQSVSWTKQASTKPPSQHYQASQ